MSTPSTLMPSLNALRAFESAARHLSFKNAADELHVSASAVGHLIADLEAFFGCQLFERHHRRIELTPAGRNLLPGMRTSFEHLRSAVRSFQRTRREGPLVVSVDPTFGVRCLIPRLERFRARYPDIAVRIDPTPELADPRDGDVDVCIRYGRGNYPDLRVETIIDHEDIIAVCSPDLLNGEHPLRTPLDIHNHTLIDRSPSQHYSDRVLWSRWFKAAGLDAVVCKDRFEVPWEEYAIVSAIQGHGITLASSLLVADDMAAGRLVQPFDASYRVDQGYFLVAANTQEPDTRIEAFWNWIFDSDIDFPGKQIIPQASEANPV